MNTNFHGNAFPDSCVRFAAEARSRMGPSEEAEAKSPWYNHVICMEAEPDTEDTVEEQTLEQHLHGVHLLI